MYLNNELKLIGFEIKDIDFSDDGSVDYEYKSENLKIRVSKYLKGKIIANYYEKDKPRQLLFIIDYVDDDFFIINYLKTFISENK